MTSSRRFTHPRQVLARLAPPLWCTVPLLLPVQAHRHGRLCTIRVSVCRKYKVHINIWWLYKWTLNVPAFWYRFGACKKTSISLCVTQKIAGIHGHASKVNSELPADVILCPHGARSASPPGPDPGHQSPARPTSRSHSLTTLSVVPCLWATIYLKNVFFYIRHSPWSMVPCLRSFFYYYVLRSIAFCIVYNLQQQYFISFCDTESKIRKFR